MTAICKIYGRGRATLELSHFLVNFSFATGKLRNFKKNLTITSSCSIVTSYPFKTKFYQCYCKITKIQIMNFSRSALNFKLNLKFFSSILLFYCKMLDIKYKSRYIVLNISNINKFNTNLFGLVFF